MVELIKHSIQGQGLSFLDACQMYDTDGDGWLSAMEVIQAVTHLDNAVNPKDIATLLKFADADGDGEGEGGKRCRFVCVMLCGACGVMLCGVMLCGVMLYGVMLTLLPPPPSSSSTSSSFSSPLPPPPLSPSPVLPKGLSITMSSPTFSTTTTTTMVWAAAINL